MPEVGGVRHSWVHAGDLRVHLAEAGPQDAPPVLLLHGWPQHWYEWRHLVPLLGDRFRLLMPDLRGLGWTEVTTRGYEKDQLARDQLALLDTLGLDQIDLIGHDWGGYAGFLMCLLAPQRVRRYMPLNIITPWPSRDPRTFLSSWRAAYQLPLIAPLIGPRITRVAGYVPFMLRRGANGSLSEDEIEAFAAPLREPERAKASARYYRSFQAHDFPKLAFGHWAKYRLRTPTRMIYGDGDFVVRPQMLRGFERYADDMEIEFVPGVSHFIADERPELVAERAREFFAAR
jgi:pimeloyl-ACP methyl ester carboxylesterase